MSNEHLHGYIAMFCGRRLEIRAASLYAAKTEALRQFKPSKAKANLVSVMLAERADGTAVTHNPGELA